MPDGCPGITQPSSLIAFVRRRNRIGAFLSPPFVCRHGVKLTPRAWNVYRGCGYSCGTTEPERWWHRLGWHLTHGKHDPFGRGKWRNPF